jgi:hypothetical protein
MFALVLQKFAGKEHLVKNRLISALDKVGYLGTSKEQYQKIGWRSAEKMYPLFSYLLLLA